MARKLIKPFLTKEIFLGKWSQKARKLVKSLFLAPCTLTLRFFLLSFVDLRRAQLYVSLVFYHFFLIFWQTPGYPPGVKPSTHAGELGLRFLGEIALFRKPATIFLNISQNLPQNITKLWKPLFSYIMIVQDKKTKRLIISLFNTVFLSLVKVFSHQSGMVR